MEGFLRYEFGGLIFGGAYTRRGLFSEFYSIHAQEHKLYYYYYHFGRHCKNKDFKK